MLDQQVIGELQQIAGVRMGIDKVVLGIPLAKDGKKDYATKFHLESEIWNSVHAPKIKKFAKAGSQAVVARYFNESGKQRVLTIVVGAIWGKPYCQFVFNPNRLSQSDWVTIEEVLCTCFDYGLRHLLEQGVIRKLELSLDFENVLPASLVSLVSRDLAPTNYKGTRYHGKRTSTLSVAVYNKTKQLQDVEGISSVTPMTRVEARLVLPNSTLLDIAKGATTNPWAQIFRNSPQVIDNGLREVLHPWAEDGNAGTRAWPAPRNIAATAQGQERISPATDRVCLRGVQTRRDLGRSTRNDPTILPSVRRREVFRMTRHGCTHAGSHVS